MYRPWLIPPVVVIITAISVLVYHCVNAGFVWVLFGFRRVKFTQHPEVSVCLTEILFCAAASRNIATHSLFQFDPAWLHQVLQAVTFDGIADIADYGRSDGWRLPKEWPCEATR